MASELRVPTVAMAAEVTCVDGRVFRGRVFVPASSSLHGGPMRAEEWMNGAGLFFPFLPDDAEAPVILNKTEVLTVTVASDPQRALEEPVDIDRGVQVECGAHVLRGHLHIDMPPHHSRVLDYLNRGDGFLVLHDGERVHLVQKQNITRVVEVREG
jgi:hypothetical protein